MGSITKEVPYSYGNLSIPGGGYVTGFHYHPKTPNILYCRTDIGGCYRYSYEENKWISLVNHVTHFDRSETFPLAIALDPNDEKAIYVASGLGHKTLGRFPNGYFSASYDYGETWTVTELPCHVHGNAPGRGTGYRMVVDPSNSNNIYFASQEGGLIATYDKGKTFKTIEVKTANCPIPETNLTFVWVSPDGNTLVVSGAGIKNEDKETNTRAHSLFISHDKGETFTELPQPLLPATNYATRPGYVGHRYDYDGRYFYVTLNQSGRNVYMDSYSCDTGDVSFGRIIRYDVDENYNFSNMTEITPIHEKYKYSVDYVPGGFGGICSHKDLPGYLIASTICNHWTDIIWESYDYGENWTPILHGLDYNNISFNASYMKPEYNGGGSLIHWLSDIKINPFNPNEAYFNSGTGVFRTTDLQSEVKNFSDNCTGIEETVHLNVYSPVKGDILALDIVGDLGGFVFKDLDTIPENSFADEKGDRYITSINADYPDEIPNTFVATPRGNWTGKTCGGVVYSDDAGETLHHLAMPYGLSKKIDSQLEAISHPNNNSGWVAISPDGKKVIWSIAAGPVLPADTVVYSDDLGETFRHSAVDVLPGAPEAAFLKVFYDRVDNNIVYGFGEKSRLYVSLDAGVTFAEKALPENLPIVDFSAIDARCEVEIRGVAGKSGHFIMAMNIFGLWELIYDKTSDSFKAIKLSDKDDAFYCVGLGIMPDTDEYINNNKALYVCATIDGIFGFFRSLDWGKTWEKINNNKQMFGEIKSIDADKKVFGRYYIATGTVGLKYGTEL